MKTRLSAIVVACSLLAARATAQDTPRLTDPAARAHLDRGLEAYAARDYETAIDELSSAYEREANRDVLFAWAQAERLSGDCPSAIGLYRRYLEAQPSDREAEQARAHLARCEHALSTRPPNGEPGERPPRATTEGGRGASSLATVRAEPARRRSSSPAWYTDWLGDALAVTGLVAAGAGTWLLVDANDAGQDARDPPTYDALSSDLDRFDRGRLIGIVLLSAGAALLVTAVIRYLTLPAEGEPSR